MIAEQPTTCPEQPKQPVTLLSFANFFVERAIEAGTYRARMAEIGEQVAGLRINRQCRAIARERKGE